MDIPKLAELLATPDRWTRDAYARDKDGAMVDAVCDDAICWCLRGAVHKLFPRMRSEAMFAVADAIGSQAISCWNDAPNRTHAEVLAVARRADELIAARLAQTGGNPT